MTPNPENSHHLCEQIWEKGFRGHQIAQLKRMATLSLHDKLKWLEEAQRIAQHLQKSRLKAKADADSKKA